MGIVNNHRKRLPRYDPLESTGNIGHLCDRGLNVVWSRPFVKRDSNCRQEVVHIVFADKMTRNRERADRCGRVKGRALKGKTHTLCTQISL